MRLELPPKNDHARFRRGLLMVFLALVIALSGAWYLEGTVPRRATLASGTESGVNSLYTARYADILARDGIKLDEKTTAGGAENMKLLNDPDSGIDLAIIPGGIYKPEEHPKLAMLAALYYEPLWVFYRDDKPLTQIDELRHKRIAIGSSESSVRAFVDNLLIANNITETNTRLDPRGHLDAVEALRKGDVDAIFLLGPVKAPAIWVALNEPKFKLMNFKGASAYERRFTYITRLTLPPGSVDFAKHIPEHETQLIGTKAMLVARDGIAFPLIQLLLDAARQVHAMQGYFEEAAEFPNTMPVDIPVSVDATRHLRFGPKMLQRYLPLVAASYVERVFILMVPLVVVLIPLLEFVWTVFRTLVMRKIYQLYGELKLLEREVEASAQYDALPKWLETLERIEKAAGNMNIPDSFATEAFVLREHVKFVRRELLARVEEQATRPAAS